MRVLIDKTSTGFGNLGFLPFSVRDHSPFLRIVWLVLIATWIVGCGATSDSKTNMPDSVATAAQGAASASDASSDPALDMKMESLPVAEFIAQFHLQKRPETCELAKDFAKKIDPTLRHFERVEVILADGRRTEIRMQQFGAWGIWKNSAGNYEMLTTLVNNVGTLMHLHTLNPRFESLGTFEVARRSYFDGEESVKKGYFEDELNYRYTVASRRDGVRIDSVTGWVVVANTGNYKIMDEVR